MRGAIEGDEGFLPQRREGRGGGAEEWRESYWLKVMGYWGRNGRGGD